MILVTGASGLLGASILLHARDVGREVVGLCHSHALRVPGIKVLSVDLTDCAATKTVVEKLRPTSIIHCAAVTSVDWCEDHPIETERANVQASACLAAIAVRLEAKFVYVSTDAVFDGERGNYAESDDPCPLNVYANSKLRGEQEVMRCHPGSLIARVNIYGWNAQDKYSLAEWILAQLAAGKPVPGFTDLSFSPALANDLAEVVLRMLDLGLSGLYHAAGSESISKYEFAMSLARTFGMNADLVVPAKVASANLRAPRPRNVSMNVGKLHAAVGRRMPDLYAGLHRFKELRDNGHANSLKDYSGATEK